MNKKIIAIADQLTSDLEYLLKIINTARESIEKEFKETANIGGGYGNSWGNCFHAIQACLNFAAQARIKDPLVRESILQEIKKLDPMLKDFKTKFPKPNSVIPDQEKTRMIGELNPLKELIQTYIGLQFVLNLIDNAKVIIEAEFNKSYVNQRNDWGACFNTVLSVISLSISIKIPDESIQMKLQEELQNIAEIAWTFQKKYPQANDIIPTKEKEDLLQTLIPFKKLVKDFLG